MAMPRISAIFSAVPAQGLLSDPALDSRQQLRSQWMAEERMGLIREFGVLVADLWRAAVVIEDGRADGNAFAANVGLWIVART